jgi:hypothetical protein
MPSALIARRLRNLTRQHGGDERAARLDLIGIIIENLDRSRRNESWPVRWALAEMMLQELWRPLIPWMVTVGQEWGIEVRPEGFVPPYPGFDRPAKRPKRR